MTLPSPSPAARLVHQFQADRPACVFGDLRFALGMCGRLNQFADIPALSLAGKELRIERRKKKKEEDKMAELQVINNICPTDYADVLTVDGSEMGIDGMRFGLVPSWAKGTKVEVGKQFGHTFNASCESIFELASFRGHILRQRCLIPVRGGMSGLTEPLPTSLPYQAALSGGFYANI